MKPFLVSRTFFALLAVFILCAASSAEVLEDRGE